MMQERRNGGSTGGRSTGGSSTGGGSSNTTANYTTNIESFSRFFDLKISRIEYKGIDKLNARAIFIHVFLSNTTVE
jgi:hypothetical protein